MSRLPVDDEDRIEATLDYKFRVDLARQAEYDIKWADNKFAFFLRPTAVDPRAAKWWDKRNWGWAYEIEKAQSHPRKNRPAILPRPVRTGNQMEYGRLVTLAQLASRPITK
jgi:hypothetical protein